MRYVIREKFFRFGDDSEITDETGKTVFKVDGKVLTLRDRLVIRDAGGREVGEVQRKLIALRPTYTISIGGEQAAQVRKHFFTPFRDRYTIDIPGPDDLEMSGNIFDHEFTIRQGGNVVATASKHWFSIRDAYGVEIADGVDPTLILASVLALELAEEREHKEEERERQE